MRWKTLDDVTPNEILKLVEDQVEEGSHLEFKRELMRSDTGKGSLLKQVGAFANAGGGDIVFGVAEDDRNDRPAVASKVVGLGDAAGAELATWIDQVIRDRSEPTITAFGSTRHAPKLGSTERPKTRRISARRPVGTVP